MAINVLLNRLTADGVPLVKSYPAAEKVAIVVANGLPELLQLFDEPRATCPIAEFAWGELIGYEVVDAGTV